MCDELLVTGQPLFNPRVWFFLSLSHPAAQTGAPFTFTLPTRPSLSFFLSFFLPTLPLPAESLPPSPLLLSACCTGWLDVAPLPPGLPCPPSERLVRTRP